MAIFTNDNFEVRKAAPIDTRSHTQNLTSLITLPVSYNYQDMLVWVIAEEQFYRLASGDGSTEGNWVLATKFLEDETNPKLGGDLDAAGFNILNANTIQGHRPLLKLTDSFLVGPTNKDHFVSNTLTQDSIVTVDDTSGTLQEGVEIEVFHGGGAFKITFVVAGAQSIISKDGNLVLATVGSAAVLKYLGGNVWALIGDLTA